MKTVIATCLILAVSVMAFFCIFERAALRRVTSTAWLAVWIPRHEALLPG